MNLECGGHAAALQIASCYPPASVQSTIQFEEGERCVALHRRRGKRSQTRPRPQLRIAVLTDDRLFGEGLLRIIAAESSFLVADDGPDVLLMDSRTKAAFALCASLKSQGGPAVIFVASPDDDYWASEALDAGARGILTKNSRSEDLLNAIGAVHEGLIWARRRVLAARIDQLARLSAVRRSSPLLDDRLSIREREVFRQAATGLGNKELAGRLAISEATVKVHLTRIFLKLGLRGRAELAAAYHGILPPDTT